MKVVTTVSNEQVAHMLKDQLEANGIKAYLENEGTGDIFNGLSFADIPIMVSDEDYDQALVIANAFKKNIDGRGEE